MNILGSWSDTAYLKRLFKWQSRTHLAPVFGKCTIAHYQGEQDRANKALTALCNNIPALKGCLHIDVILKKGDFYASAPGIRRKWFYVASFYGVLKEMDK